MFEETIYLEKANEIADEVILISVRNVVRPRAFFLTCLKESILKFWNTTFVNGRAVGNNKSY